MPLRNKLLYTLNETIIFCRNPLKHIKTSVVDTIKKLPQPVQSKVLKNKFLRTINNSANDLYRLVKPIPCARVYIKKGIGRMDFFDILNKRKIDYVLLRWWQNLPDIPYGEDMDILIKDEQRDLINDLVTYRDNGTGLKCDIYTVMGSRYGSWNDIPYFQSNLSRTLLNTRVLYKGAYVPSPVPYFASLVYHALFHKGYKSGIPGYSISAADMEHDYATILNTLAIELGIDVAISLTGLHEWLKQAGFAPADDTLTKLITIRPELSILERSLYSDVRGGELLVYVVRQQLYDNGLLDDFKIFLQKKYQFDIIDTKILTATEQDTCASYIRGGKWDKGPFKYSGGLPAALVIAFDYHPTPLTNIEQLQQSRMTDRNNMLAKYEFRERQKSLSLKGDYNGVHSADNELDAWSYVSFLGEEYRQKVYNEAEKRRNRYARIWGIKKVLSTGPLFKIELIDYKGKPALKKTFRPGKERYFERELFAAKVLSKEMDFIPALLEEGDGYVVLPYLENILLQLPEKKKKQVIQSKKNEIIRVIQKMYASGFAFINFTPKNILVTASNAFYCAGFEFLYKYDNRPATINDCYEIAGLPASFEGDRPDALTKGSSFNKIWEPYIGKWKMVANPAPLSCEVSIA